MISLWKTLAAMAVVCVTATAYSQLSNSQPMVSEVTVSNATVIDVHLRPLFTTTIRLPDAVSSVAVGAPTRSRRSIRIRSRGWSTSSHQQRSQRRAI